MGHVWVWMMVSKESMTTIGGAGHREEPVLPTAPLYPPVWRDQNRGGGGGAPCCFSPKRCHSSYRSRPEAKAEAPLSQGPGRQLRSAATAVAPSPHALSLPVYRCCLPPRSRDLTYQNQVPTRFRYEAPGSLQNRAHRVLFSL